MANNEKSGAVYINVDLEIRSQSDLKPLAAALLRDLDVLYVGKVRGEFFLSLEVPGIPSQPDTDIARIGRALSGASSHARKLWRGARDRVFDVGIEKRANGGVFALALGAVTVKTLGELSARTAITLYPAANTRRLPNPASHRTALARRR